MFGNLVIELTKLVITTQKTFWTSNFQKASTNRLSELY